MKQVLRAVHDILPWNSTIERPSFNLNDPLAWEALGASGAQTDAGIAVTPEIALSYGPVWQAVSTISGDVAISTLNVHRRGMDAEIDELHPAQWLVAYEANEETPAFEFWRRLMVHALLWQNGYAYIERDGRFGAPRAMYNLLPDRTRPERLDDGRLMYVTEVDGQLELLFPSEVFHLKGLSIVNGIGYSLVNAARNAWGLALAERGYTSKFFANGAQAAGILEVPASWQESAVKNLEEGFRKKTTGKDNWFKTVILRDGAKFHSVTIDPERAQTPQLREAQVRETARFFNIPPSKLGATDSTSYNSQEQARLDYKQGCLNHWFGAIRGEAEMKLLSRGERRTHYMEHNTSKLVETDAKSMAEILQIERNAEVISANEWRRKINLPRRKDPGGDEYLNPNVRSARGANSSNGEAEQAAKPQSNALSAAARAVCEDVIRRAARRLFGELKKLSKQSDRLEQWLSSRGGEDHRWFIEMSTSAALLVSEQTCQNADDVLHVWTGRLFDQTIKQLVNGTTDEQEWERSLTQYVLGVKDE